MGSFPLDTEMSEMRMRFGAFIINHKEENKRIRAGFRMVGDRRGAVFPLTRGGRYV
jgi:hypothetical protein